MFQLDKAWLRVQQQEKLREANVKRDVEKKEKKPKKSSKKPSKLDGEYQPIKTVLQPRPRETRIFLSKWRNKLH